MSTRLWAMQNCIARRDLALRSCRVSQPICWSIAVTLLVRPKLLQVYLAYWRCTISSDATGAAEVVAGVSGILALHHLQWRYSCGRSCCRCIWHTGVAPSPACISSYSISRHMQGRSRCFCEHLFCSFLCHLDAGSRLLLFFLTDVFLYAQDRTRAYSQYFSAQVRFLLHFSCSSFLLLWKEDVLTSFWTCCLRLDKNDCTQLSACGEMP